jgi:hypothetical protein
MMPSFVVCTLAVADFPYFPYFRAVNERYAALHGYRYVVRCTCKPDRGPSWEKVTLARELLPECDYVLVLDSDAHLVTDEPLDRLLPLIGEHAMLLATNLYFRPAEHWPHCTNQGVYLIRNCPESLQILREWERLLDDSPAAEHWRWTWALEEDAFEQFIIPKHRPRIKILQGYQTRLLNHREGVFIRHYPQQSAEERIRLVEPFYQNLQTKCKAT